MAAYATSADVQERHYRPLSAQETRLCEALLEDAAVIIDSFAPDAAEERKKIVSCRMVLRALPSGGDGIPFGATQSTQSALGYSQSWTISGGAAGELYLSKLDKQLLGLGSRIGSYSPVEALTRGGACE